MNSQNRSRAYGASDRQAGTDRVGTGPLER
jgi:hypothetical protein